MFDAAPDALPDYVRNARRDCPEPLKAARALREIIEAGAAEGAATAYVTDEVVKALCEAGLFGLKIPRVYGGAEVGPREYIDAIEEVSYADGSTGWVLMAGNFAGGGAVGLGPSAVERVYGGNEGNICAAQVSSLGKAERVEGGYRIWDAHFHFGSSSRYSSWFGGAFQVYENGQPALNDQGKPKTIMCWTSRDKVRLKDNWDVFGLSATGSYDFDFVDQVIPDDWVTGLPGRPQVGGPIHAITVSIGHVAWALGVGRRALDEIHALATSKRRFQRRTLIDQERFQLEYGRNLAAMQAARALVYEVYDEWYALAQKGPAPIEIRARGRLAACWATEVALKAAQFAMFSAGSDGVRNRHGYNTLQRVFRDMQTGATHRHIDQEILIECAQVALGVADPGLDI